MIIKNIKIQNFRNLLNVRFSPHKKMNIFFGENAQGKTNILESIWLLSGKKSFRGAKDREMVNFKRDFFKVQSKFIKDEREQEISVFYDNEKKFLINGVETKNLGEINGKFSAVVFSPSDISLVGDGPSVRREFLDNAILSIYPAYEKVLKNYQKAVAQRNNSLKDLRFHSEIEFVLDSFENSIANYGFLIIKYRNRYVDLLNEFAPTIFSEITRKKEILKLEYCTTVGATIDDFRTQLRESRESDMFTLKTSVGPHRDNLEVLINGVSARNYGSQGQKRTASISIKLSEGEVIEKVTSCRPIILLDDIMSELDPERQNYILNQIENKQVFLTCCDPSNIVNLKKGKVFKVENGKTQRVKI